jgi:hypothetical protein
MVYNHPAWITQLFAHFQKAEDDVRLLAEQREDEDTMEIDISDMHCYDKTLSTNESRIILGNHPKINHSNPLWQKNVSTKLSETARYSATRFGLQLPDCKTIPKAKQMAIQNVLIALMMISAFSR